MKCDMAILAHMAVGALEYGAALKNTGLLGCIKARELHRPEAEEIFHVGLLARSAALVLLL